MDLNALMLDVLGSSLGRRDTVQISHGLNLVLKLKNPLAMPLLLAKIRQKQRKINAGLGELNFVHFARFLPTPDHTALQVITEFDGPLAPYVLDFAIEIGDVFDMLLSHTEGTAQIVPVAEHPAEFLAFVETHNTVRVLPGVNVPDWPLYAAYPEQTVLDITGPRSDLPIPKPDRWATEVERDDVQGNILEGFGAEGVKHFVLRVLDAQKARAWLADKAKPGGPPADGVPRVTSAARWDPGAKPELMLNVGITYPGLRALGVRDSWHQGLPEAFKQGALERAEGNFDVGSNAPNRWWLGGPAQAPHLHLMVSLYHRAGADAAFAAAAQALALALPQAGLQLLATHDAAGLGGKGWFGHADGIAQPRIAVACPGPDDADRDDDLQPAATAGEFVLGKEHRNIYGGSSLGALPEALASNGSFCAVRVLMQDTNAFSDTLQAEAARLGVSADWLAAKLMGRWYAGAPLSLHPDKDPSDPSDPSDTSENGRNDFDYAPSYEYPDTPMDHAGVRCPVGAHIRRTNPRSARVAGARYARRLMRRGMHYEIKDTQGVQTEVGLFGLFICADLERQFEFIQRQWINGDRFAAGLRGTRDPIAGAPGQDQVFEIPMPGAPALKLTLPQFVHTRGSLYLFMPGLKALRNLGQLAVHDFAASSPVAQLGDAVGEGLAESLQTLLDALNILGAALAESDLLDIARASVGLDPSAPTVAPPPVTAAALRDLRFDPRRRDFQIDPYPVYARMRAEEPVHHSPLYGGWFVFRHADVVTVCTDNAKFSAAKAGGNAPRGLFTLDPPAHTIVRNEVKVALTAAAAVAAQSVQSAIGKALAAIGTRLCFDLVDDFARPVSREVYFDILGGQGIDAAARLEIDRLARTVMKHHDHLLDDLQRFDGTKAGLELAARLGTMLAQAAAGNAVPRPLPIPIGPDFRDTFLGELAQRVDWLGAGPLNLPAAVTTLVNLTVAGYMSVEFLLATGIRRLLLDGRAGWMSLQANPAALPKYLEEMRRTDHALSVVDRYTKVPVTFGSVTIPANTRVCGVLASANRDALVHGADADTFNPNPTTPRPPHLGLGHGTHECLGKVLENLITGPAISGLMAAMPGLRLRSGATPPWFENFYFRSFDHLPVTRA